MHMRAALASILLVFYAFVFHTSGGIQLLPQVASKTDASFLENPDWPVWGGSPENNHYSPLAQINRTNVKQLEVAWSFDSGESGGLQTSPIIVDGVLYGITPTQKVFALDAATGKPISAFGKDGRIDLRDGLGRNPELQSVALTSPASVYKDLIIVGGRLPETLPAPPGDIRAYDVRSGQLRWSFHTIPHPGEFGYDTWPKDAWKYTGGANNWTGMAVDVKRGIVYVPTGSAAFDFYGADRLGDNLFADSLIALNAETGERLWHFQAVKHDLWDRDFPSPPTLVTVKRDGKDVESVAQTTKQGFVYLFERTTGKPLFPIEYRKYPPSTVQGEIAAAEQPLPSAPTAFARQDLTANMLTSRSLEVHQWALEHFRKFRNQGQFVPFSVGQDTLVFPGFDGGAEWG